MIGIGKLNLDLSNNVFSMDFCKAMFCKLTESLKIAVAIYKAVDDGKDFVFDCFNKTAEKIEKVKKEDLIGKSIKEVFPTVVNFGLLDVFRRVYKTGRPEKHPVTMYKDKRISGWRENYVFKLPSGEIVAVYKDLTKEKQKEEQLRLNEKKYRLLFEGSLDGVYETTIDGRYIDVNSSLVKMLGYDNKKDLMSIDIPTQLYFSKNDRPKPKERNRTFETILKKKDGSVINVEISSRVIYKDKKPAFYNGIVRDITGRKKAEADLKFLSFHDKLTGLYNRAYFEEESKRLDSKRQLPLSLIMADINGLKIINDAFGHKEGDLLIYRAADILKKCFREEDVIARWGGDEFIILLPKTTKNDACSITKRVEQECSKTEKRKIPISISMGCSTKTNISEKIEDIIIEAEEQMYERKLNEGKSFLSSTIDSFKKILMEKSIETEEHTERVSIVALQLGKALNLSNNELSELSLLSKIHDIGKVAIPEKIILKKGKLSKTECETVKKHPRIGYNIALTSPHLAYVADDILSHHEWWDGSGYPQGLKGDKIPLTSRILAIADAYDVMIEGRPYKDKMDIKVIIKEFKKYSEKQFDPHLVNVFLNIIRK